ncbi:MAG: hypothetical protein A2413_12485 [Treponema sp. RIFOXYC1_FULL_61_9]|nr:MAG: hypothetical protein A2413_12485 [Treponema sp. RIFOXYC1_FULL_61_9]
MGGKRMEIQETSSNPQGSRILALWFLILSFLILHAFFRFPLFLREGVSSFAVPSFEALLTVPVLFAIAWFWPRGRRTTAPVVAVIAESVFLFALADSLVELNFNRPLSLVTDVGYLPDLFMLLKDALPLPSFLIGLALPGAIIAALGRGLALLFARFCETAGKLEPRSRKTLIVLGGAALAILGSELLPGPPVYGSSSFPRLAAEAKSVFGSRRYETERQDRFRQLAMEETPAGIAALDRLAGRDVFLFILESYGYTLYAEADHFSMAESFLRRFETRLKEAGYFTVSNFLASPAFGGNSWLADSALVTGVWVPDQIAYEALLKSDITPLAQRFNEAGYVTVNSMPATTQDWREGEYFRFAKKYYYRDFDYRGPGFRWAPMPDQYAIDFVHRREVIPAEDPLFVQFVMISGHYPFSLIPRRLEDWSELGDGSPFADPGNVHSLPIPTGAATAGSAGYAAAMEYQLDVVSDYAARFLAERKALIIVVGDHQPYSGITGKGKPTSVPIHALSRDPGMLKPFLARGYTAGWVPRQPPPHAGLDTFLPGFLEDFTSPVRALPKGADR